MDMFFKENDALHGSSIAPVIFMSCSHLFTPCFDLRSFPDGHDTSSLSELTLSCKGDEHPKGALQQNSPLGTILPCGGLGKTSPKIFFIPLEAVFKTTPKSHGNWTFGGPQKS